MDGKPFLSVHQGTHTRTLREQGNTPASDDLQSAQLDISDEMDVEADRARYEADRAKDMALTATYGIDAVMKGEKLDAILFPAGTGAAIAAKPGYPTVCAWRA